MRHHMIYNSLVQATSDVLRKLYHDNAVKWIPGIEWSAAAQQNSKQSVLRDLNFSSRQSQRLPRRVALAALAIRIFAGRSLRSVVRAKFGWKP
jgi:hypothetical protein